jgi:hypothetical protein
MVIFQGSKTAENEQEAASGLGVSPLSARLWAAMAASSWGDLDFGSPRVSSQAKVAKQFGVATRTVEKWIARGMPRGESDYSIPQIRDWLERANPAWRPESSEQGAASVVLRGALRLLASVPDEIVAALKEAACLRIEGTTQEAHQNSLHVALCALIQRFDQYRLSDEQFEQVVSELTEVLFHEGRGRPMRSIVARHPGEIGKRAGENGKGDAGLLSEGEDLPPAAGDRAEGDEGTAGEPSEHLSAPGNGTAEDNET